MRTLLKDRFGLEVEKIKLYRARNKARGEAKEDHAASYSKLRNYCHMVLLTNPGSIAIIQSLVQPEPIPMEPNSIHGDLGPISVEPVPIPRFQRCFVCLEGAVAGFLNGYRPFIGLDGCHLKRPYGGIMLATGLIEAIHSRASTTLHRYYCFHILKNFEKKYPGIGLKNLFWEAAETANFEHFVRVMDRMKVMNGEAHKWLLQIPTKHWARHAHDTRVKVEHLTNNFCESFNSWLDELHFRPPMVLLEGLRMKMMLCLYSRVTTVARWDQVLTPGIRYRVKKLLNQAESARVYRTCDYEFLVDYDERRVKQSIPFEDKLQTFVILQDFCDPYFHTETWRKCYSGAIHAIPDEGLWPQFDDDQLLAPPKLVRPPGRPKKHRRRDRDEARPVTHRSTTVKCSRCGIYGHNARSCQRLSTRSNVGRKA
ncbi:Zinc finger, CCHC-type [Parasponia andersonii]|uniref:Zinc finger, CCHC-type n=1 Tax=Parasponia andersonii TaxID=3476 RepID=A0A2P5E124_PARAD|nr:Zinc finger, CCHC-type [Parasponia andersonii]